MERNMLEVIDASDEDGRYHFEVKKYAVRPDLAAAGGDNLLRELLRSHFCTFTTCTQKSGRTRRWTDGLDATAKADANGHWHVSLNLAKLFHLPSVNARAELVELRSFFEAMKAFFEERVTARAEVQFLTRRVKKGNVAEAVECCYPVALGFATSTDAVHTARLRELVSSSRVVQMFLQGLSQSADTVGPWAFGSVTETMLYGLEDGPAMQAYLAQQREILRQQDPHRRPLVLAAS